MGSCVSVNRSSESAMKLKLSFGSKNDKLEIPPSPVKAKPAGGDIRIKDVALTSWTPSPSAKTFGDYGSKEEAFFDSQAWLESDCEDDFLSVNGEFTPSRGSTPVNQGIGQPNKSPFEARLPPKDAPPAPSPTTMEKKKRLLELFKESVRDDEDQAKNRNSYSADSNAIVDHIPPKSGRGTPFVSGPNSLCNSERTPNSGVGTEFDDKPMRSSQCCLPSLISCRSFSERKKKMSPAAAIAINEKA